MMQAQHKVGDEVGYCRHHQWGTLLSHGFSRVAKVNGHGHVILENGKQFDKHGHERNATYGGLHLVDASNLRAELQHIAEQRARNAAGRELEELIKGRRNGHGDLCAISEEVRARMIELINKL
jgi:hypothetical protein